MSETYSEIINKNLPCRVKMFAYTIGKKEITMELANIYKIKMIVDENRYRNIQSLKHHTELFSTNPEQGFIRLQRGLNTQASKLMRVDLSRQPYSYLFDWLAKHAYLFEHWKKTNTQYLQFSFKLSRVRRFCKYHSTWQIKSNCF